MDRMVAKVLQLIDDETVVAVVSDHGGTPNQHHPVEINEVLERAGFVHHMTDPASGRRVVDLSRTTALGIGLVHIFLNLRGREPDGIVAPADYEATRQVIDALTRPASVRSPWR
jgi:predicted AlkP superfamily phosphohydrolase/phosphomutase